MSIKVQFRASDEAVTSYVRQTGINPNEVAREAFEEKVRAMIARDRRERLARRKIRLPKGAASRWTRDERDG